MNRPARKPEITKQQLGCPRADYQCAGRMAGLHRGIEVGNPRASAPGNTHMPRYCRPSRGAIDDKIMPFGFAADRFINRG